MLESSGVEFDTEDQVLFIYFFQKKPDIKLAIEITSYHKISSVGTSGDSAFGAPSLVSIRQEVTQKILGAV